jgi:hypothetical protein
MAQAPALANQDPVYVQLRQLQPAECFVVENLRMEKDAGGFLFRNGKVCPSPPVLGRVTSAVFVGDGEFSLTPPATAPPRERPYVRVSPVQEQFGEAVFFFTDGSDQQLRGTARTGPLDPQAPGVLQRWRDHLRAGSDHYEGTENLDAEILAALYNPKRPGFFRAYITGRKHSGLRFMMNPLGDPGLPAAEEVELENHDPEGDRGGVWYLGHFQSELKAGTASSNEDKDTVRGESYTIDTTVAGNDRLAGTCTVGFRALKEGERVVLFDLAPTLRVSRVEMGGKDLPFIQEDRKHDADLYIIFPEPLSTTASQAITIHYEGDKVVRKAGGGNFWVGSRENWYPNLNAFRDRARFDLTFHFPKRDVLVSVGKLEKEWKENGQNVSHWVSEVPLPVAGFNFGAYRKKQQEDEPTQYVIEGYATTEVPDFLQGSGQVLAPAALNDKAIAEARASVEIFTRYFGPLPYGRIAITQQPAMFYGQSWPTLVYLPLTAYLDPTQRWQLFGGISRSMNEFVDEVTSHEVSHQWWGHLVGERTFHDEWLSEGFAFFAASLFLQGTEKTNDKYLTYWRHAREMLLEKNEFKNCANDAGPVWLGRLLATARNDRAYDRVVYRKGGYVLHMLRMMMWDARNGDSAFARMMQDFAGSYRDRCATTEDFQRMVEKHMQPSLDLDGNGKMDWFFQEWVYGTDIPSYGLDYTLTPGDDNKTVLKLKVSQSGVGEKFKMPVGIYGDFDGKLIRLGFIRMTGSTTTPEATVTLPRKPNRVLLNANYDVLSTK